MPSGTAARVVPTCTVVIEGQGHVVIRESELERYLKAGAKKAEPDVPLKKEAPAPEAPQTAPDDTATLAKE